LSVISETPETWRNAPVAVRNLRKKLKDITGQKYVHVLKGLGKVLPRFCTIYMM
jgi:predicted nuclease of restriction endonuclease-like RecB superfamily